MHGYLIVPRLRVQNANAISSPLTWGFPSITAFLGLMWNLQRQLSQLYAADSKSWHATEADAAQNKLPIQLKQVAVICHSFQPQVTQHDRLHTFHLTRNPLGKDEKVKAIVEEGRAHIELSLVFLAEGAIFAEPDMVQQRVASKILAKLESMRIAGGSVLHKQHRTQLQLPYFQLANIEDKDQKRQFKYFQKTMLPGSALVLRHDLLLARLEEMTHKEIVVTALDAWLDITGMNIKAREIPGENNIDTCKAKWEVEKRRGWLVPIPVGYNGLTELFPSEMVKSTRDDSTPFRFVESLYSIGEWVGVHRLSNIEQILWSARSDEDGSYFCSNDYALSAR